MTCVLDEIPVGTIVHFVGSSNCYCYECNQASNNDGQDAIYLGHQVLASGKYAVVLYKPPSICPVCGKVNPLGYVPCDDGDVVNIFTQKVEIVKRKEKTVIYYE